MESQRITRDSRDYLTISTLVDAYLGAFYLLSEQTALWNAMRNVLNWHATEHINECVSNLLWLYLDRLQVPSSMFLGHIVIKLVTLAEPN